MIGSSARTLTAWDEPATYYVKHIYAITLLEVRVKRGWGSFDNVCPLLTQGRPWDLDTLRVAVEAGQRSNPLAARLGLRSQEAVQTFVDAGMPGLDMVLLSSRYGPTAWEKKGGCYKTREVGGASLPPSTPTSHPPILQLV